MKVERVKNISYIITLIVCAIIAAALNGCTICRHVAITDAERLACEGHETRVAAYYMGYDALILQTLMWGYPIWQSHAQAQVLSDGEWMWVGMMGNVVASPTYSTRQVEPGMDYYHWSVPEYRALLTGAGKSTPDPVICKGL